MSEKAFEVFGKRWRVVWQEDEALLHDLDAERVDKAWKRLFGTDYPGIQSSTAEEDWGDTRAYLVSGKVVMSSYDGHSIAEEVVEAGGEKRAIAPTPPAPPSPKLHRATAEQSAIVAELGPLQARLADVYERLAPREDSQHPTWGQVAADAVKVPARNPARLMRSILKVAVSALNGIAADLKVPAASLKGAEVREARDLASAVNDIEPATLDLMDAAASLAANAGALRLDLAPLSVRVTDAGYLAVGEVTFSEAAEEELGLRLLERVVARHRGATRPSAAPVPEAKTPEDGFWPQSPPVRLLNEERELAAQVVEDEQRAKKIAEDNAPAGASLKTTEEKLREALQELADLMDDVRHGDYMPDSFTTQPARLLLGEQPQPEE